MMIPFLNGSGVFVDATLSAAEWAAALPHLERGVQGWVVHHHQHTEWGPGGCTVTRHRVQAMHQTLVHLMLSAATGGLTPITNIPSDTPIR